MFKNNCLSAMSLTNYVLIWSGFSLCFTMFKFYSSITINWPNLNLCYNLKPFVLLSQEFLPETGPGVPADESPSTQCRWPLPPQGAVEVRNSQNYFIALARLATRFFNIYMPVTVLLEFNHLYIQKKYKMKENFL